MIKITHEMPTSLLLAGYSKEVNALEYCLLHLTYEDEAYKQYYINAVKEGREVLLDNSLFELGDALSNEQLAQGVIDLQPTSYVIPDCLNDKDTTIARWNSFVKDYPDLPGLKIGVCHGASFEDMVECYEFMAVHADIIAVPVHNKSLLGYSYNTTIPEDASWEEQSYIGRQQFFEYLVNEKKISDKPHHLLGCTLAKEFDFPLYKTINIYSLDTSNPVVAGLMDLKYENQGLKSKPSIQLQHLVDTIVTEEQKTLIDYNIKIFKHIVNK